jgi:hypothetical protein
MMPRCPLLSQSGDGLVHCKCPLSGVKRTWPIAVQMSAYDPKRTSCRGAKYQNLHTIDLRRKPPGGEMQRRGESLQRVKGRRTAGPKARKDAQAIDCRSPGASRRSHAREQQTATSEVLQVRSCGERASAVFCRRVKRILALCQQQTLFSWSSRQRRK